MSERNYYVICDDNCKFPAMTKEETLAAIEQAIQQGTVGDIDTGFITKIKEQNKNVGLKFWVGTQAEYNSLTTKENNCFYIITDDTVKSDIEIAIENLQSQFEENIEKYNKVLWEGELDTSGATFDTPLDIASIPVIENYSQIAVVVGGLGKRWKAEGGTGSTGSWTYNGETENVFNTPVVLNKREAPNEVYFEGSLRFIRQYGLPAPTEAQEPQPINKMGAHNEILVNLKYQKDDLYNVKLLACCFLRDRTSTGNDELINGFKIFKIIGIR